MATVTRVHGSDTAVGTLYTPNSNLYIIQVKASGGTAVDLRAQDSAGANAVVDGIVEVILKEIAPLAWFTQDAANGYIFVVLDKAINNASELQTRIRRLGTASDITGTEVTTPNSITFAVV